MGVRLLLGVPVAAAAVALPAPAAVPAARNGDAPPLLKPIHAVFEPERWQTVYTAAATSPEHRALAFRWTLTPPANDPRCNNHGRLTASGRTFTWQHGGPESGRNDGCDHSKEDPLRGHRGTVAVVVSDGAWSCTATFFGTSTGPGGLDGPAPGRCVATAGTTTQPIRAALPPRSGTPIEVGVPVPDAGEVGAALLEIPLGPSLGQTSGKPDVGVRLGVARPGSLPNGLSVEAGAAESGDTLYLALVLPHVLERGATAPPPGQFAFDTTIFSTYRAGLSGSAGAGATIDLFLVDESTGKPLDASRPKTLIRIDDLLADHTPPPASVCRLGFGVVVAGGADPDGVDLQGFVVNSHTGAFDLSVFGFDPVPLSPAPLRAVEAVPVGGRTLRGAADLTCGKSSAQAAALRRAVRP